MPLYAVKLVTNLGAVKGKPTRFDVLVGDTAQGRTFELQTQTPYECENCKNTTTHDKHTRDRGESTVLNRPSLAFSAFLPSPSLRQGSPI